MGKGSVELLEHTLGCTLAAARAVYNGAATAAEILGASREPARGSLRDASVQRTALRRTGARQGTFPGRIRNRATRIFDRLRHTQTIEPTRKIPICRDFGQAAEGTRTLDLLHGKRHC